MPNNTIDKMVSRLIIENRNEAGVIDSLEELSLKKDILELIRQERIDELKQMHHNNPGMFNVVGIINRGGEDFKEMWWDLMRKVVKQGAYKNKRIEELKGNDNE